MPASFRTTRRVEFCETDAAGIAHFSAFFQYMEQTEHAFLRHIGLSVFTEDEEGTISWPRVSASCDFQSPIRFEDVLEIELSIARLGERSVTYRFDFCTSGRAVASGQLTVVCCRLEPNQPPRSIPIPETIGVPLEPYAPRP